MDFNTAVEILGIGNKFTDRELKKAYYKNAIKYHPDKNGGCAEASEKFKKIKKAYDFLSNESNIQENIDDMSYSSIIKKCIYFVMPDFQWDEMFLDSTIQTVLKDCKKASMKLFEQLSKDKAFEVYVFLSKHKDILNLEDNMLNDMLDIIKNKTKHDNIVILNPDINDLLNDKIYKLEVGESIFYVPLWHNEIIYDDISGNDLIIRNIPELDENVYIDNKNHVHIEVDKNICDLFKEGKLNINLGDKVYDIPGKNISILKTQTIVLNNSGILLADHDNLYNVEKRGDIYIHLSIR
tara:strand:- start:98 stop:982 length:885 start_codon:yes stop_codon:yes gene_type:complete